METFLQLTSPSQSAPTPGLLPTNTQFTTGFKLYVDLGLCSI